MPKTDEKTIETLLSRGVEEIVERGHLERRLREGDTLRVKLGIDPTAPDLHLGHTVVLRKLRQFQDAGHRIVLIIGDFTAQIGDPSGRDKTRPPLTEKEIKTNEKKYLAEAGRVIDVKKAEIYHNSKWLGKGLKELLEISRSASVQQLLERSDFQKRVKEGNDITLLELFYSLLQGYDSVAVRADLELGGTDQKFNLLMGRRVQRHFNVPEQDILTTPLIEGTDGTRKMSKSYGNYVGITEEPREMFGKLMTVPDALVPRYFETLTDVNAPKDAHPRDAKLLLAETITALYHGEVKARAAREAFVKTFSEGAVPEDVPELVITLANPLELTQGTAAMLVRESGVAKSNNEIRRLVEQGAVTLNGEKLEAGKIYPKKDGDIVKIGKHRFYKIKLR